MSVGLDPASMKDQTEVAGDNRLMGGKRHVDPFIMALVGLLMLIVVVASITVPGFLNPTNFTAVLQAASITGIVAVGLTFVTISGSFVSLGTGPLAMTSAVTFAAMISGGLPLWLSLAVALLLGCAMGAGQGAIVALGMNPVITTLAAGAIAFGVIAALTEGRVINVSTDELAWLGSGRPLGIPVQVFFFLITVVLASLLASRTVLGRSIRLVGANRAAARISGISRSRVVIWAFLLLGLGTTIAGVLIVAQLGQANVNTLSSLTIDAIAAVLVGGTAVAGGIGSPLRSAIGATIIALLNNTMVLVGASFGVRQLVVGTIVIAVVILLRVLGKRT